MQEKFTLKKAVSLTLALSFIVMSYTGIMLFFTPRGKIANWTDWTLLGFSKTQYTDLHITSLFLFLTMGIWHIYYNWKPLTSYLKNAAHHITPFKKEFLLALALNAFFVGGTLAHVAPMQSIVDLNTRIKNYWEREEGAPPFGHAEEATLASLAPLRGIDTQSAVKRLRDAGINVKSAGQTLQQIAEQNGITAQRVYELIAPKQQKKTSAAVSGLGRRSLGELSSMGQFDLEGALAYLKAQGYEAGPQTTMRDAATALGTTPYTLFETLKTRGTEK
jgi:hypothetical protein